MSAPRSLDLQCPGGCSRVLLPRAGDGLRLTGQRTSPGRFTPDIPTGQVAERSHGIAAGRREAMAWHHCGRSRGTPIGQGNPAEAAARWIEQTAPAQGATTHHKDGFVPLSVPSPSAKQELTPGVTTIEWGSALGGPQGRR